MRVVDVRELTVPISRYLDLSIPSGHLNTSAVAVVTDVMRNGKPIIGYGFASMGRFAQGGLIRERFAPRLLTAGRDGIKNELGTNIDPFRAWKVMMAGEKPGGHGERCVAVGTLDMALWDAAAKIADVPLYVLLAGIGAKAAAHPLVNVYASGGYYYPTDDTRRLSEEVRELSDLGYKHVKIKIGAKPLADDMERIDAAIRFLDSPQHLAVDAMYSYGPDSSLEAAEALAPFGLWWFEDVCDPLDFETLAAVTARYETAVASGEGLFSAAEARLLDRHAGLRRDRDILVFDPVHCYGVPGYLEIVESLEKRGWDRSAFWPHGGHLFCLHLAAAFGLGGAESNPLSFHPFGGFGDHVLFSEGQASPPELPGIGFEGKPYLKDLFAHLD